MCCWELKNSKDMFDDEVALLLIEKTRETSFTTTAKNGAKKQRERG